MYQNRYFIHLFQSFVQIKFTFAVVFDILNYIIDVLVTTAQKRQTSSGTEGRVV